MRSEVTRRELLAAVGAATAASALPQGVLAQEATAGDWPGFGYNPAKTGYNPDGEGPRTDVGGAWQFNEPWGEISAGSAVADGVVYAPSKDGNLYAVDAESGDRIDGWPVVLDDESVSPPTVADGAVYVGDDSGVLYAIDTDTAEIRWRFGTDGPVRGSPTVVAGTVYITSNDGSIYAVDAETGQEAVWEFETGDSVQGGVAVERAPDGEAETVYAGNDSGLVFALDPAAEELRWEEPFFANGQIRSVPAVANGSVFVGTVDGTNGFVHAIDADTGEQRWRFLVGGPVIGTPVVTDEMVYIASRDQHVYAVDIESGEQRWRFDTGRQLNNSPVVVGDTIYTVNFDNDVFGVSTDGEQRFTVETGGTVSASPAVADGRLYVGSEDGTLYALESGGEFEFGSGDPNGDGSDEDGMTDSPLSDSDADGLTFLVLPAAVVGFFTLVAGGLYAVFRSDWAEQFAVDEAPVESLYDDEDEIPDYDDRTETEAWSLIVDDVIRRASERTKTARENVIITKHVNLGLESPITAYEIESARAEKARITLTETLIEEGAGTLETQPLNEGWTLGESTLTFEAMLDPDETIKTMVGRTDCPEDRIDELLGEPNISIETIDSQPEVGAESED